MKTSIKNLFLLPGLIAGLGLVLAGQVAAQIFTTLHSFSKTSGSLSSNTDGALPRAVIISGNILYGTAQYGGRSGQGAVFAVNTEGTGFTNLHSFGGGSGGFVPVGGLIFSGDTLYGTTFYGGSSGAGTVFQVNTDGTGFTTLHVLTYGSDGAGPSGELILSGNTLYGTAAWGGSANEGTVFMVNIDGTGFTTVHSFAGYPSDGARPYAGLVVSGNTLYGTTGGGSDSSGMSYGTVFALNTDGTGFTNLYSFTGGSDGSGPGGLILSGNKLYGTGQNGGSSHNGTVFAVNTDGTGFTNLHSFTRTSGSLSTNIDGVGPVGLFLSGNTLYGTAGAGGSGGSGTIFSISLPISPPQLTLTRSAVNIILTWPTNATGFILQSTTNLVSPAVWTAVSPGPVVIDGQNAVTNLISGTQQFFRLSQ